MNLTKEDHYNGNLAKYRFLIAEDNPDILELLREYLTDLGAQVLCARNGKEAITVFQQQENIDLLVLDVKMPKLSGIKAYKKILSIKEDPVSVIFLSGAIELEGFLEEISKKPFVGILEKPFTLDTLEAKISEILS